MNLKNLYQEMIIEHNKNPRNFRVIEDMTHVAHGKNPLCGDDYYIFLKVNSDKIIDDIAFHGTGCAISKSSASLLTTTLKGRSIDDSNDIKDAFLSLLTADSTPSSPDPKLGKLKVFEGVRDFPIRIKCATLIWRAFESSLLSKLDVAIDVSTE